MAADVLAARLRELQAMRAASLWLGQLPPLGHDIFRRGVAESRTEIDRSRLSADVPGLIRAYLTAVRRGGALVQYRPRPITLWSVKEALRRVAALLGSLPDWASLRAFLPADLREAAAELRRAGLQAAADGAIADGIFHSLDGSADRWRADGMPHRWEQDGTRLELRIANARAVDRPGPAAPPPPEDRITLVAPALGAPGGLFIRRAVVDLAAGPAGSKGRIRTWETSHH
jgi:hypothetical protein